MVGNDELMAAWLADLATTLDAIDRHGLPGGAISDLDSVVNQLRDQAAAFNVGMLRLGLCSTSIFPSRPGWTSEREADAGGPVSARERAHQTGRTVYTCPVCQTGTEFVARGAYLCSGVPAGSHPAVLMIDTAPPEAQAGTVIAFPAERRPDWQIWEGDGLRRQAAQERRQDRVDGWDTPPVGGVA